MIVASACEVWGGPSLISTLNIEPAGTVTVDRANLLRRIAAIAVTDPFVGTPKAITPVNARSMLAPFGNELRLYYGRSNDDTTPPVLTPLGVFGIETSGIADTAQDLLINIAANDRARAYQRAGFTDAYTIPANTNIGTAIQALLASRVTGFTPTFVFATTTATTGSTPLVYIPGDDPWQKATDLATACGFALWHDTIGNCIFLPVPDPSGAAIAWSYDEGNGNLAVGIRRILTRTNAPNWIIRDGSGPGITVPLRSASPFGIDLDPSSPTYVYGPYGVVTDFASSDLLTTQAMCNAAAQAKLLTSKGAIEAIDLSTVTRPQHDVDDVIEITRVRAGVMPGSKYVVDSLTFGFGSAALLQMNTRTVQ